MRKSLPYIIISLAILASVAPLAYWSMQQMKLDTSIDEIMGTDNRSKATYDKFNEAFNSNTVVIAIAKIPDLFSDSGVQNLHQISSALQQIPDLKDIKSLTHSARPIRQGFNFDMTKMITLQNFLDTSPKSDQEWLKLKEFICHYPMTRNLLISADGHYAIIMAVLNRKLTSINEKKHLLQRVNEVTAPFLQQGIDITLLSEPFITAEFHTLLNHFLIYYVILSLSFTTLIILFIFRSFKITFLMLSYQFIGLLVFPFIFYLNQTDINVYTFIIIPLVSAIQLTFLTHFYSVYQQEFKSERNLNEILKISLATVFKPSLLAMLTSAIGLASLCFSELDILKNVGKIGLEALIVIFIITFLPAALYVHFNPSSSPKQSPKTVASSFFIPFLNRHSKVIIFSFATITIFSLVQIPKLKVDIRTKEFLHPDSETRKGVEIIDQFIGGVNLVQLNIHTQAKTHIQDYEVLSYLHTLRQEVLKIEGVSDAYTYSQLYTTIHQLFLGDNFSNGDILASAQQNQIYSTVMNSLNFPFQHILQNDDRTQTLFIFKTKDLSSKKVLAILKNVLDKAQKNKPKDVSITVNNGMHSILASDQKIVDSQINSLLWSFAAIFICLILIWKSLKLSCLTLITNAIPILFLFALLVFTDNALNSINVMIAPIILGIVIDDSIHFISYFRSLRGTGKTNEQALNLTFRQKVNPILCTSLILATTMALFTLAPFPPIQSFGLFGALAILGGLITTLVLLPCLLRKIDNQARPIKEIHDELSK